MKLTNCKEYSRKDIHGIFGSGTKFTPQVGTWGLQGIVPIPDRDGDYVFYVTFGKNQGDHHFDESVTKDGILLSTKTMVGTIKREFIIFSFQP